MKVYVIVREGVFDNSIIGIYKNEKDAQNDFEQINDINNLRNELSIKEMEVVE